MGELEKHTGSYLWHFIIRKHPFDKACAGFSGISRSCLDPGDGVDSFYDFILFFLLRPLDVTNFIPYLLLTLTNFRQTNFILWIIAIRRFFYTKYCPEPDSVILLLSREPQATHYNPADPSLGPLEIVNVISHRVRRLTMSNTRQLESSAHTISNEETLPDDINEGATQINTARVSPHSSLPGAPQEVAQGLFVYLCKLIPDSGRLKDRRLLLFVREFFFFFSPYVDVNGLLIRKLNMVVRK